MGDGVYVPGRLGFHDVVQAKGLRDHVGYPLVATFKNFSFLSESERSENEPTHCVPWSSRVPYAWRFASLDVHGVLQLAEDVGSSRTSGVSSGYSEFGISLVSII